MSEGSATKAQKMRGISAIPSGWTVVPLKTFLRPRSERGNEDLQLLSVYRDHGVVPFGSIDGNHNKPSLDLGSYKTVRAGDLVLNKMKTWQGSLGISDYEGIVSPAYIVCRVSGDWDRRYLHHSLRSPSFIAEYASLSYGIRVGQWDIRFEDFREVLALHPPLDVQRRTVAYLDAETARIDALVDRKQRFIDLLLERRTTLITQAVTKGLDPDAVTKDSGSPWLGDVPGHWRVLKLRHLADVRRGTADKTVVEGDRPTHLIQYTDIYYRRQQKHDDQFLSITVTQSEWVQSRVVAGDLLVTASSETSDDIGHSSLIGEGLTDHVFGSDVVRVRPRAGMCAPGFAKYLMENAVYLAIFDSLSRGVTRFRFSMDDFKNVLYVLPPISEQEAIVDMLDSEYERTERLVETTRTSIELLREYRTALISAAVTGQIDILGTETSEDVA